MQKFEKDNYRKKLAESLLMEDSKILTVHYHEGKNRWALLDEGNDVYGVFDTPEEILESVESGKIKNSKEFENILRYRKQTEGSLKNADKLFYMDCLYGKTGHKLRESMAVQGDLPGSEMDFDEVMSMLDDGTELPNATDPHSDRAQGKEFRPLNEMDEEELYELCEGCYEEVMSSVKNLYSSCDYKEAKRKVLHGLYEQMWESRKKTLQVIIKNIGDKKQDMQSDVQGEGMQDQLPNP